VDLGNIVYILAVLAYFIYQATKGKKGSSGPAPINQPPQERERPASFEDLLKEIREVQKPKPAAAPEPKPSHGYESTYQKPMADSTYQKPESSYVPRESTYEKPISTYSKPVSTYVSRSEVKELYDDEISLYEDAYDKRKRARASDLAEIPDIPTLDGQRSEVRSTKSNPYAHLLKNPNSVRDAVVLSEILNRKHF
jgi:hypothetical protein